MIHHAIQLTRPQQWLKNVFVMIPMFFGGSLLDTSDIKSSLTTFFAFSFIASSIYCGNDIIDVEADRRHPVKSKRPIASGAISMVQARLLMLFMLVCSLATLLLLDTMTHTLTVGAVLVIYYVMNLLYCSKLKQ